ncbi:MAG: HAMP domain-containing sensor histidine kinase [Bacteroidota bacterium]
MKNHLLIEKFIYSCSHELRAPISSIQGLVRIAEYYPRHDEINRCLAMIGGCTDNILGLISKMELFMKNNRLPVNIGAYDPMDLIDETRSTFATQLDACGITLVSGKHSPGLWSIDKKRVSDLINHVVANSISFYDEKKEQKNITITVSAGKRNTIMEIKDNGLGIEESQLSRVFDIFFRGSTETIGHGMGLFLAKELADKMGATIKCKSKINEGTTIAISFPNAGL